MRRRFRCFGILSGLTCTHENAMVKAGAQMWAAEQGIALVFPDTSPRGAGVPDHDDYDLGQGAGFLRQRHGQDPWAEPFPDVGLRDRGIAARVVSRASALGRGPAGHHRSFDGWPWRR